MVFCSECGAKLDSNNKFCPHCGTSVSLIKNNQPEEDRNTIANEPTKKEKPKKSTSGKVILLIFWGVIIGGIIFFILMLSSNEGFDDLARGTGINYIDPCERELNSCNHGCGEGIFNSVCKEKCSYDYRNCRG